MKTTVLTSLLIAATSLVYAQSTFIFTPSDTVIQNIPDNSYTQTYIYEENQTSDSLTLGVEVVSNDIPASWDGMVCIYGFCLINFPDVGFTSQMAPIHDTINGYVRVTANPLGSTESGSIRVRVYNIANPMDGDTCTFILNPESNTSIEDHELAEINVYPNPTSESVTITSEKMFSAINIIAVNGKTVWHNAFGSTAKREIFVSHLPKGTYFIELLSDNSALARKRLVINE